MHPTAARSPERWLALLRRVGVLVLVGRSAMADASDAGTSQPAPAAPSPGLAQSMFDEARSAMDKGDLDRACSLFAASERLDPGGGTLLNLALCHEKQGRLATACAEYNEALSLAIREGRHDRQNFASERIAALRPQLPYIAVLPPSHPPPGLEVQVDGAALPQATWGVPFSVDPGAHDVRAEAPGRVPFTAHLATAANGQTIEVRVPDLLPVAPEPQVRAAGSKHLAPMFFVAGAVGLAALGTSAITGFMALAAESSSQAKCSAMRDYCPDPSGRDDASRAATFAWVSTVALGVGAAAVVTAVLWPRRESEPSRASMRVGPVALPGGGGVVATGSF